MLKTLLENKHTSFSASLYAAVKVGSIIAKAWFPKFERQISVTSEALEGFAVLYLGASAGDALQSSKRQEQLTQDVRQAIETHDTSILTKPTV